MCKLGRHAEEGAFKSLLIYSFVVSVLELLAMEISIPYLNNAQVAVIRKEDADKYKTTADMADAIVGAEAGSAGESAILPADAE